MSAAAQVDRSTQRIEELIIALDALADRSAADAAHELVQRVLELHGAALARIMETVAADPGGMRLASALAQDDSVNAVLLLHGLHPMDFAARVRGALAKLHPHLGVRGVAIEDLQIDGNQLSLRIGRSDAGRYSSADADAIRRDIRQALLAAAPDAAAVEIEGPPASVALIPVSSITIRRKAEIAADAAP